jgi:hypothetical protein
MVSINADTADDEINVWVGSEVFWLSVCFGRRR